MATNGCELFTAVVSAGGALLGALIGSITGYLTARYQFRATAVATGRQAWIASLRDALAEYQVCVASIGAMSTLRPNDEMARQQLCERAAAISYKIKLLLNPDEPRHVELVKAVEAAFVALEATYKTGDHSHSAAPIHRLTELGQRVLKREWERVKTGE